MASPPSVDPQPNNEERAGTFTRDLMASVVVFLVALPLCMGVAIASGAPPALGLVTGIIGGIVVGFISGQPLQVSGPAAGLAVMTWQLIQDFGLAALGLAGLICGVIQLTAGIAGLGRWFRAVSPAVIQGMLTGIGVLILGSQFHVMLDDKPRAGGLANLLSIPEAVVKGVLPLDGSVHHVAAGIGLLTIACVLLWNRFRPYTLKVLPGPLIGVVVATVVASLLALPISRVAVPTNLGASLNWVTVDSFSLLTNPAFIASAIGLAFIASAETLLCATALDRMHDGTRTLYNKELRAQGVGNLLCGLVGALPMTGVIVRSSANVGAGGKTKWSAVLHGVWILAVVALFPQVLAMVPTASLAAVLVYIGWKLLGIESVKALARKGRIELAIWGVTVAVIVSFNLLAGVVTGFALALARLLYEFAHLEVGVSQDDRFVKIKLRGAATFMSLPKLAEALESIPDDCEVHVCLDEIAYIDHACIEILEDWHERHPSEVILETDRLKAPSKRPSYRSAA